MVKERTRDRAAREAVPEPRTAHRVPVEDPYRRELDRDVPDPTRTSPIDAVVRELVAYVGRSPFFLIGAGLVAIGLVSRRRPARRPGVARQHAEADAATRGFLAIKLAQLERGELDLSEPASAAELDEERRTWWNQVSALRRQTVVSGGATR